MKCSIVRIVCFAVIVLAVSHACMGQEAQDLLPHDPILISGDGAFTAGNGVVGGSGTEEDPFVVAGLHIDASGESYGIRIEDVTRHVLIRDCLIGGASRYGLCVMNSVGPAIEGCRIEEAAYQRCYQELSTGEDFHDALALTKQEILNNMFTVYSRSGLSERELTKIITTGCERANKDYKDKNHEY